MHPKIGKSSWPLLPLSMIAEEVRELYEPVIEENFPYIGLEHIEQGSLALCGTGLSSETQSTKKVFRAGDILFGTLRPYFRKLVRAKFDGVCSTDITVIRAKEKMDRDFLFYFIANHPFIQYATSSSSGTRMPRAKWSHLSTIEWNIPTAEDRKKITPILSAYDDLIENNLRRIKILEEMTQTLYREWFVKFRFPGHQKVKMVNSPLGKIPEGWEIKRLSEVVELAYGKGLKEQDRIPGDVAVYGSSGVVGCHNQRLVESPGIIVGRKGNVGSVYWTDTPFFPIDTVFYVITKLPLYYVYFNLRTQNFISGDAAVPGLNRNQAYSLPFILPTPNVLRFFSETIEPIFNLLNLLKRKNGVLRQTRDLLLPKLISGELDVSELDIKNSEPEEN